MFRKLKIIRELIPYKIQANEVIIMTKFNNFKDLSEKEKSIRRKKLLSILEEIDKKNYDATTTALAQLMAIQKVWSDLDIDWLDPTNKIKKK